MAINKEALYDYWKSLDQPASTGGGDVPYQRTDPSIDKAFAPGSWNMSVLDNMADATEAQRNEAMSFSQKYKPEVGEVQGLSTHLAGVLEEDSPYIQRARTIANEQSNKQGLLNSSMAAGAATGAAIDRGLDVARGDLEAEQFNVGEKARQSELQYDTASGLASAGQQQRYALNQQAVDTVFKDYFSTKEQQDNLEAMAKEFKHNSALDWQKYIESLDKAVYENTEQRLQEIIKQNSLIGSQYLKGWAEIQSSDMSPEDKVSRLNVYNQQVASIAKIIDAYGDIQINEGYSGATTDEFYSIA